MQTKTLTQNNRKFVTKEVGTFLKRFILAGPPATLGEFKKMYYRCIDDLPLELEITCVEKYKDSTGGVNVKADLVWTEFISGQTIRNTFFIRIAESEFSEDFIIMKYLFNIIGALCTNDILYNIFVAYTEEE